MDVIFHPENLVQGFGLIVCGCLPLLVGMAFVIFRKLQVGQSNMYEEKRKQIVDDHAGYIKSSIKKAMQELASGNRQNAIGTLKDIYWPNRILEIIEYLNAYPGEACNDNVTALFGRTEFAINKARREQ